MNVYLSGVRLGLGDVIARSFHRRPSARVLAQLVSGFRDGRFDRIGVLPEIDGPVWNPASLEIFDALGIQTRTPEDVRDWVDVLSLEPEPGPVCPVTLPTVRPDQAVPREYVLLSQWAGREDRCLDDYALYRAIKDAAHLPIVKIGRTRPGVELRPIPCDLDLTDRTTVPQSLWLAKHAAGIVAPCSWLRNMTWAFGTPVIEVVQHGRVTQTTMDRTNKEYREGQYGIDKLNYWLTWPNAAEDLRRALALCVGRLRGADPIPTSLWPAN